MTADFDVAIVGAGPAGIAAGRALQAAGLRFVILEARPRVGGRAVTVPVAGHPVDLGAHWLHAGPINPLVRLGFARGEPLRHAPQERHLFVGRRPATAADGRDFGLAFAHADRALSAAAHRRGTDRSAASALPPLGRFGANVAAIHGLVCGRPLDQISLQDFASLEYEDNWFIAGGYGAYIARLAAGLPVRLGTPVTGIDWRGPHVAVATPAGTLRARAVIVAVPPTVLQAGAVAFAPACRRRWRRRSPPTGRRLTSTR